MKQLKTDAMIHRRWIRWTVYSTALAAVIGAVSACGGPRSVRAGEYDHLRPKLVAAAMAMRGKPYRYGGAGPRGFDCSGLVQYSYEQFGFELPRNSYKQYKASSPVYESNLRAGDLVFFRTNGMFVSHVGIYIGDREFVHAPGRGKSVSVDSLDTRYWRRRFVGGGRFL